MNEFECVRLHPHLHGLVAVCGDFFHVIFRNAIYSLLQDFAFTALEISTVTEQNKITFEASQRKFFREIEYPHPWLILARPELEPVCRWGKLDRLAWHVILLTHPQLAKHCTFGALSEADWAELIAKKPELSGYKPFKS